MSNDENSSGWDMVKHLDLVDYELNVMKMFAGLLPHPEEHMGAGFFVAVERLHGLGLLDRVHDEYSLSDDGEAYVKALLSTVSTEATDEITGLLH